MNQCGLTERRIGKTLQRDGMRKAAMSGSDNLRFARGLALELGRMYDTVTADQVRKVFESRHPDLAVGNWCGSIFKDGHWDFVGFAESAAPSRHRGIIRRWRLKNAPTAPPEGFNGHRGEGSTL